MLTEHGNDNAKRRDMILKVLKTEDLLTLVNGKRVKPYATPENPSEIGRASCRERVSSPV